MTIYIRTCVCVCEFFFYFDELYTCVCLNESYFFKHAKKNLIRAKSYIKKLFSRIRNPLSSKVTRITTKIIRSQTIIQILSRPICRSFYFHIIKMSRQWQYLDQEASTRWKISGRGFQI